MKKFSRIVESNEDNIPYDPKRSIGKIIEYLEDTDEYSNLYEHILQEVGSFNLGEDFDDDFDGAVLDFESFKKFLIKYNIVDIASNHIAYYMIVTKDFMNKLPNTGKYMKKINED